jgi:cytidine deaminase
MANDLDDLIDAARKVRERSYSPYSRFAVGAAARVASGQIFTGTNVENISFGLTLCAERAAVAAAIAAGESEFRVLVLVADSAEPIVPCGACRQVLAEFTPSLRIVSVTVSGKQKEESLQDLLPAPRRGILEDARS